MMKTVWRFPPKLIIELIQPSPLFIFKGNKNTILKRLLYPHVHCSIIYNSQGVESTNHQWMIRSRKRGIRTQCYSPSKEEIPPFAATWVEIEGIMLRETVRQRKMKYSMVSCIHELTEKRKNVKNGFMYRENRLVDAKNRRVGWMHDGGCKVQIAIYKVRRL